jgi:hypothetical protein
MAPGANKSFARPSKGVSGSDRKAGADLIWT